MPGVRIRPYGDLAKLVKGDELVIVRDITRPLPDPLDCHHCGQHDVKTYHLQLVDGVVIVSETIWANLSKLWDCGGFELVNEVKAPPTQSIIVPTARVKVKPADM